MQLSFGFYNNIVHFKYTRNPICFFSSCRYIKSNAGTERRWSQTQTSIKS